MTAELRAIDPEPIAQGAEELLEDMLERVRAGEVSSLAIVYVDRQGCSSSGWSKVPSFVALIGATHTLLRKMTCRFLGQ